MSKIHFFGILLCALFLQTAFSQNRSASAKQLVDDSIAAMGGAEKLRSIKVIHTKSVGHYNLLEQSERPDGPWLSINLSTEEWRDVDGGNIRRSYEQNGIFTGKTTEIIARDMSIIDNGNGFGPNPDNIPQTRELLAIAPERILLNALAASDLQYSGTKVIQGSTNNIVSFTWNGSPVKIYLNQNTDLLTMTDVTRARPTELFWGIWGDFSEKNYYSFWNLEEGGFRYPHQVDTFYNEQPLKTNTITGIEFNIELPKDTFSIPDAVKSNYSTQPARSYMNIPLGRPNRPPVEIAPNFVVIPGNWNVTLIKQDDGIVVIEAPISSSYSVKVIEEVKRRYPNEKIKAVISTSDAFPHFGGLREYIAARIPVYILDLNQPIINRLIASNYKTYPDNLEKKPDLKKSKLNIVSRKTTIGTGANQLELYPIRTESGERMIMIYAPQLKVIYGSDLIQPLPNGGFFMLQYISELKDAVERENLEVERAYAMHSGPLEWKKVLDALKAAEK